MFFLIGQESASILHSKKIRSSMFKVGIKKEPTKPESWLPRGLTFFTQVAEATALYKF